MGLRSFGSLILIFLIIMLLFGTNRLREIGSDLASAIKGFRKALNDDDSDTKPKEGDVHERKSE